MSMRGVSLVILALLALPAAAPAQRDGLEARNRAFLQAVRGGNRDSVAAFFPRRADWALVQTLIEAPPGQRVGTRRFAGADARAVIGAGGEACWSFEPPHGGIGPIETLFGMQVAMHGTRWRRVGGNRFVPPGEPAASPTFVRWQREEGRWAVAAVGDQKFYSGPPLAGREPSQLRDTVTRLPPTPVYATGERWYVNNEPFAWSGRRYVKQGLPRRIDPALLRRIDRRGMVGIYAERGPAPERFVPVLYIPIAPGEFQPYMVAEAPPECG